MATFHLRDARWVAAAAAVVLVATATENLSWSQSTPTFSLTKIDPEQVAQATALTNDGRILGVRLHAGEGARAVLYDDGNVIELGTLGGLFSWPEAVNEHGAVVGYSSTSDENIVHSFLYENGVMHDFDQRVGMSVTPYSINDDGFVAGGATVADTVSHAFVYADGVFHDLGTLGAGSSGAYAINNRGEVTGFSNVPGSHVNHAFVFRDGTMQDLGAPDLNSGGVDINEQGDVVGQMEGYDDAGEYFRDHAFLYSDGVIRDLGTLGGPFAYPMAMNDDRTITGYARLDQPGFHAFLYEDGVLYDLNQLIAPDDPFAGRVQLVMGIDVNDPGDIVAQGNDLMTGEGSVYLLKPKRGGGGTSDLPLLVLLGVLLAARGILPRNSRRAPRLG